MTIVRIHYLSEQEEKLPLSSLGFHPEMLKTLHELGIIEIQEGYVRPEQLRRLHKVMRLKNCLGVNLPGAAIILELLDRIEEMQEEIERLKKVR